MDGRGTSGGAPETGVPFERIGSVNQVDEVRADQPQEALGQIAELDKHNCAEILLMANRSGSNVVLSWADGCIPAYYQVFRTTDISVVQTQFAGEFPWRTTGALTTTDTAASEPLIFYNVRCAPQLTLDWTGEFPGGDPYDDGDANGFLDDAFSPRPVDPYLDGIANLALSGDPSEFRVKLTCSDCPGGPSEVTSINLWLDRNDDGDFSDAGELVPLSQVDPLDTNLADGKLYHAVLTGASAIFARDASGQVRWALADGTGAMSYYFTASTASAIATGPATLLNQLTLLNTANELVESLGKPVVATGNGSYSTDWATALAYFEEAEGRVAPTSPYNQASDVNRHQDYLNALMACSISETAYTLRNYKTLFQTPGTKLLRDEMLDWIAYANEQLLRMDHLTQYALSEPDTAWSFDFPMFSIWLEDGTTPLVQMDKLLAGRSQAGAPQGYFSYLNPATPVSSFPLGGAITTSGAPRPFATDPVYTFEAAQWDRADAYLLRAIFRSTRGSATLGRIYEKASAARNITVADYDAIQTWIEAEDDAEAHYKCDPEPCPPLNGLDDDGDGLIDDLGYAARVFEEFDGVGIYSPDGAMTLESVTNEASMAMDDLRQGMRLVLKETDIQADDATLVYGDGGQHPPAFDDLWNYVDGTATADGLPDLAFVGGDFMPVGWCPPLMPGDSEPPLYNTPLTIKGGLGDDIKYWIDEAVRAYNEIAGEDYLDVCYPEGWAYTTLVCDWGYTMQKAVADTTPHYIFNLRDDVEEQLDKAGILPSDLGPDFMIVLNYIESIDVRSFIEAPEDIRNYVPYFCTDHLPACLDLRQDYAFNGFYGDWDEPMDPIVANKFWTIEPFSKFRQDANGILDAGCNPDNLEDCIEMAWDDLNGDGNFDAFEPVNMTGPSTPLYFTDLNGDGQWNGWSDRDHKKVLYAGEPVDPGKGLYNFIYVYFQDPTFGGRLAGISNEGLNNLVGAVAGIGDGALEWPNENHAPAKLSPALVETACGNYCFEARFQDPDVDGDNVRYRLVLPAGFAAAGGSVLSFNTDTGAGEMVVPAGTWGFIVAAYDNVNNLNDLGGHYWTVTR